MAATYADQIALKTFGNFINEVAFSIEHYAEYQIGLGAGTTSRLHFWAVGIQQSGGAQALAQSISGFVAQDPIFTNQASGTAPAAMIAAVTDAQFQTAVEAKLNQVLTS